LRQGQPDVLQFPLEPGLVRDVDDVRHALGAVGEVGVVDVAEEEDVAGEQRLVHGGLAVAVEAGALDQWQVVFNAPDAELRGEALLLAALGV
jgi:hypothetical protein